MSDSTKENEILQKLLGLSAVSQPLGLLKNKLSPTLLYHTVEHTQDVISTAVKLAILDCLAQRDIELIAVASAWHDTGFIERHDHNEPIGAKLAQASLSASGLYSPDELSLIQKMILDTAIITDSSQPLQVATTKLSTYLLDADLANFGRTDFFERGELLRRELGETDLVAYHKNSLKLLTRHSWLTAPANKMWSQGKSSNIAKLAALI